MSFVFLSYAREDQDRAEEVRKILGKYHIDVWMDRSNLLPGQIWDAQIKYAIKKCSFKVFDFIGKEHIVHLNI